MVRDRFLYRLGAQLPPRDTKCFSILLLPGWLGGLDLWLPSDLGTLYHKLPNIWRGLLYRIFKEEDIFEVQAIMAKYSKNSTIRGYGVMPKHELSIINSLTMVRTVTYDEAIRESKVSPESFNPFKELELKGFYTYNRAYNEVLRGFLFQDILSQDTERKGYNTMLWSKRLDQIFLKVYRGFNSNNITWVPKTQSEWDDLFKKSINSRFYCLGDIDIIDYHDKDNNHIYFKESIRDQLRTGLPFLKISKELVGSLSD
jgi:hypothetical protein